MIYPLSRRGTSKPQEGEIVINLPLDGNLTDYSGNGLHFSGTNPVFETDEGRKVLKVTVNAEYIHLHDTVPLSERGAFILSFINNFRVEFDFKRIVAASELQGYLYFAAPSGVWGICFMQDPSGTMQLCISDGKISDKMGTFHQSQIPVGIWHKVIMERRPGGVLRYRVLNLLSGAIVYDLETLSLIETITSVSSQYIIIGMGTMNRVAKSYFRNFKIVKYL